MQAFNRERVPERVVHAKGGGAFGYFEVSADVSEWTRAAFLAKVGKRTPVLARFSTVAGEQGSRPTTSCGNRPSRKAQGSGQLSVVSVEAVVGGGVGDVDILIAAIAVKVIIGDSGSSLMSSVAGSPDEASASAKSVGAGELA